MVVLREKVMGKLSRNLLIRAATCGTVRTQNFLPLTQIKTIDTEMMRRKAVCITNNTDEDYGFGLNSDS